MAVDTNDQQELLQPLTIPQLMTVVHISKPTAYRWVRTKKIPSVRIGKRILIPRSALLALLTP
jgi:excisionase family DNA binding protein